MVYPARNWPSSTRNDGYWLYYNLGDVELGNNSPQQYKAVFYITDYFIIHHVFCRLVDITNWIIIPPPDFSISIAPNSTVNLRPTEQKNIELLIKSNTDLASEAFLNYNNSLLGPDNDINLTFSPKRVSILPFSAGSSSLHITASGNAKPNLYLIPIVANISFLDLAIFMNKNPQGIIHFYNI